VLKLEPKGLEIEKIKFKPPPKESPNKFYSVKIKTKGFLFLFFYPTILVVIEVLCACTLYVYKLSMFKMMMESNAKVGSSLFNVIDPLTKM